MSDTLQLVGDSRLIQLTSQQERLASRRQAEAYRTLVERIGHSLRYRVADVLPQSSVRISGAARTSARIFLIPVFS